MKTLFHITTKIIAILIAFISSSAVTAQVDNTLDVYGSGQVHGKFIADSISVLGKFSSDTILVTRILSKDSIIWIGKHTTGFGNNSIFTDTPDLLIQSNPAFPFNTILNANSGRVGIGTTTPNNTIQVAGLVNFGNRNAFLGDLAGNNNFSNDNVAVGFHSFITTGIGSHNVAVGAYSLLSNTSGGSNTAIGDHAMYSNNTGMRNVAAGGSALQNNTSGFENIAIGTEALHNNTTGYYNTSTGDRVLSSVVVGHNNTANGNYALLSLGQRNNTVTTANYNTAVGSQAFQFLYEGENNTAIGYNCQVVNGWTTRYDNATAIGANAIVGASNAMVLGSSGIYGDVNVGIGTPTPGNRLEIKTTPYAAGTSGLRLTPLGGYTPTINTSTALTVNEAGDVILANISAAGILFADNGLSVNSNTVELGQSVGAVGNPAELKNDREIPLNGNNLIFSGSPDTYPGKIGVAIGTGSFALRSTPITMQVNGSISLFDGNGNTSLFFGEEQFPATSGTLGEWGIQYTFDAKPGSAVQGGLNFWKPSGSHGYNFGNAFLFLSDNGNVGIGATSTTAPANALEITSYSNSPQPAGLRFTNLTSASTPSAFSTANFLSVDSNGDVILVRGNAGSGFGAACSSSSPFDLTNNWRVGLNNNNLYLDGNTGNALVSTGNSFIVGNTCGYNPQGKLDVYNLDLYHNTLNSEDYATAANFQSVLQGNENNFHNNYGVFSSATGSYTSNTGIMGKAYIPSVNTAHVENYGVEGWAVNNSDVSCGNIGVKGVADGFGECVGVLGMASNGESNNIGGHFIATETGENNFGIVAEAANGIIQDYAGYFVGNVARTGNDNFSSDSILKKNINPVLNALTILNQLTPRTFEFKTNEYPYLNLALGKQYGLVAQEVERIVPEIVKDFIHPAKKDSLGRIIVASLAYKTLNYQAFIPILIQGVKDLNIEKDSLNTLLNSRIDSLKTIAS